VAITQVGLHERGREYREEESGRRTVRNTYLVASDDPLEHEYTVVDAVDPGDGEAIPARGDFFIDQGGVPDVDLRVISRTPRQTDDIYTWEVEVEYSTDFLDDDNPLLRDPEAEWSSITVRRAIQRDSRGRPVRNSAGIAFEPPPEVEEIIPVLKYARNEATFDPAIIKAYENHVNDAEWNNNDVYTVLCANIGARKVKEGDWPSFWRVSYEFRFRTEGWELRILDNGFELPQFDPTGPPVGSPTGYKAIRDTTGDGRKGTPLLDGMGGLLENAFTSLNGNILAADTSIVLTDASAVIPVNDLVPRLWIEIGDEILEVTAADLGTNTLTVVRGTQGTTAADHADAVLVRLAPVFLEFLPYEEADFSLLDIDLSTL
jgi:hypothetical protein